MYPIIIVSYLTHVYHLVCHGHHRCPSLRWVLSIGDGSALCVHLATVWAGSLLGHISWPMTSNRYCMQIILQLHCDYSDLQLITAIICYIWYDIVWNITEHLTVRSASLILFGWPFIDETSTGIVGTLILRPPDLQRDSYVANILASTSGAQLALLVAYSLEVAMTRIEAWSKDAKGLIPRS